MKQATAESSAAELVEYYGKAASDVYFQRAQKTLAGAKVDAVVAMDFFSSKPGVLCGVAEAVFVFAGPVVAWFTTDPLVEPIATRGLRIIAAGFPFYAAGYVLTQAFNGAGDTVTPTLINLGCFWAFELPLAYTLGRPLGFGPDGVFWAMAIAFSTMSVVSGLLFRRGRWKLKKV